MRVIILAAGEGFQLDGYNKLLLKDPINEKKVIDQYMRIFSKYDITVIVGYRAIEVIQDYPDLHYIYNSDWKITNNAYSLALAIDDEPSIVISSDLFIDDNLIQKIEKSQPNCIITENREIRELNALNCAVDENGRITEIYQGARQKLNDPEARGIYKISDRELLYAWKKNCVKHRNLFVGQNLVFNIQPIYSIDKGECRLDEVNTVLDYLNIIGKKRI